MISSIYTLVKVDSGSSVLSEFSGLSIVITVAVAVVSDNLTNESDSLGRHLRRTDFCEGLESFVLSTRTLSADERSIDDSSSRTRSMSRVTL